MQVRDAGGGTGTTTGPAAELVAQSGTAPGADLETSVVSFLQASGH